MSSKKKKGGAGRSRRTWQLMRPEQIDRCRFRWPKLAVRPSGVPGAGNGLYAAEDLPAGTAIPILGKTITRAKFDEIQFSLQATHLWSNHTHDLILDGTPNYYPHKGVGSGGLAIAMVANEPHGRRAPTCVFKMECLVVAKRLRAGEELTVYYGPDYEPIRQLHGYTLSAAAKRNYLFPELASARRPSAFAAERDELFTQLVAHARALPWVCSALRRSRRRWAKRMAAALSGWSRTNRASAPGSCGRGRCV